MDLNEPVTVYTLNSPIRAELIRNMLSDEGIKCMLTGLEQAENVGFALNELEVRVAAVDADRARRLIEQYEPHKK